MLEKAAYIFIRSFILSQYRDLKARVMW